MPTDRQKKIAAVTASAVAIAAPMEGLRRVAYYDPPGVLTTCFGHTGSDIVKGKVYSIAECNQLLNADMKKAVLIVDRCQPGLPDRVLIAFSDAVYNMGQTIACDPYRSTAARMLAVKDYTAACNQLPRWDKAKVGGVLVSLPGLTKRRALERDVCLGNA